MGKQIIERAVMVPMRDGVKVCMDIYRPDDSDKHPVLILPSPYSRNNASTIGGCLTNPMCLADEGYVVIVQESRGRCSSEGEWSPWIYDGKDGYDGVEWAAAQPWSNGDVGVYGNCGHAYPVLATACEAPPHLKAIVLYMGVPNPHSGWTYSGGAFELAFNIFWALGGLGPDKLGRLPPETIPQAAGALMQNLGDVKGAMNSLPLRDLPGLQNGVAPFWSDWLSHPKYDDYWKERDLLRKIDKVKVPILHVSGWHDLMLKGHIDLNKALNTVGDPALRKHHRFVVGPWDHEAYLGFRVTMAGKRDFGPMCATGPALMAPLISKWFAKWLKGADVEVMEPGNKVRYFTMGENTWKETDVWPVPNKPVDYYLHSTGKANSSSGGGALATAAPTDETPDSYVYDPMDPVPTAGGRTLLGVPGGVDNQATVEERDDVLVYTSSYLLSPLTIAGPVSVKLYASSSAPDTDFTAKLVDVEPGGYCANVTEGVIRARYRNGEDKEVFLNPGEATEFTIDLWDVAHTFKEGHRLRLEISSSNFPRLSRNLNSKVSPEQGTAADIQTASQQVFHSKKYPSCIKLPVVS